MIIRLIAMLLANVGGAILSTFRGEFTITTITVRSSRVRKVVESILVSYFTSTGWRVRVSMCEGRRFLSIGRLEVDPIFIYIESGKTIFNERVEEMRSNSINKYDLDDLKIYTYVV